MTSNGWATADAVVEAVRRKWRSGEVLRSSHAMHDASLPTELEWNAEAKAGSQALVSAGHHPLFPMRVPLSGPTREELGADYQNAREWARGLRSAAVAQGWELKTRNVRVSGLGTQTVPVAAVIPNISVAMGLLGAAERDAAAIYGVALALLRRSPLGVGLHQVAQDRPLDVVAAGDDWRLLVAAVEWMVANPRSDFYLRQVPIPGMHTKLLETHRKLITRMATAVLPEGTIDLSANTFAGRFGFRAYPKHVRIRAPRAALGLPPGHEHGDIYLAIEDLAAFDPLVNGIQEIVVVENQMSFLVVPTRPDRAVLWGAGNQAEVLLRHLPWIRQTSVTYWGDLDTHGYAILARARRVVPHVRSVLMDVETLIAHRSYFVTEQAQAAIPLDNLTEDEERVYSGLRAGTWGARVRLEQELISYEHVERAFLSNGTTE